MLLSSPPRVPLPKVRKRVPIFPRDLLLLSTPLIRTELRSEIISELKQKLKSFSISRSAYWEGKGGWGWGRFQFRRVLTLAEFRDASGDTPPQDITPPHLNFERRRRRNRPQREGKEERSISYLASLCIISPTTMIAVSLKGKGGNWSVGDAWAGDGDGCRRRRKKWSG